jgi:hypothetical protein
LGETHVQKVRKAELRKKEEEEIEKEEKEVDLKIDFPLKFQPVLWGAFC